MNEKQMQREIEKLQREGRMPTLRELSNAVLEARREYMLKIRRARREDKCK